MKANRLTVALILALAGAGLGQQALAEGHLLAVGGMLRASNVPVYAKFAELAGGDQSRIARALFNADGSPSQAWHAIHAVKQRGGVIGGTSAGASIQGKQMPTAYGVVMDTLDFGLAGRTLARWRLTGLRQIIPACPGAPQHKCLC